MLRELENFNRQILHQRALNPKQQNIGPDTLKGFSMERNDDVTTHTPDNPLRNESTIIGKEDATVAEEHKISTFLNITNNTEIWLGHDRHINNESTTVSTTTNNVTHQSNSKIRKQTTSNKPETTIRTISKLKTTTLSGQEPTTLSSKSVVKLSKRDDNRELFVVTDTLIYSGVASGCLLAILAIIIFIVCRRRRLHNKGRFTATDQRTYQNSKIFMMGNGDKENNIVQSLCAIPANQNLWKELQSNSPNVF